jgi:hypothetical protein
MVLSKLSAHLRALPKPEVSPTFLTQVMARMREPIEQPRSEWLHAAVAIAAIVLVIAALAAVLLVAGERHGPVAPVAMPSLDRSPLPDAEVLEALLAARIAELDVTAVSSVFPFGAGYAESLEAPEAGLEWIDVLAASDWFEPLAQAFEAQDDVDAMVGALGETDAEALKEMLVEYATEG